MKMYELNDMILTVCPIDGFNTGGNIWFKPEATEEQKQAAIDVLQNNIENIEV